MTTKEKRELLEMLAELETYKLTVGLVPQKIRTNEGGMIRVAFSKNPKWYSDLCNKYLRAPRRRNNAPDTTVNRIPMARVIRVFCVCGTSKSRFAADLLEIARQRIRRANEQTNIRKFLFEKRRLTVCANPF